MTLLDRARHLCTSAAVAATMHIGIAPLAAQHQGHQMPAPKATQKPPQKPGAASAKGGAAGCDARARAASQTLEGLTARLELARLTDNESDMRAAAAAADRAFRDLQQQLGSCRGGSTAAAAPASAQPSGGQMAGMDHSKMNMGAPPPPAAGAKPPGGQMAGMDHSKMNMGAAAAPTTVRQISGPAEAALQAFTDALQIGNRDLAVEWLTPDVTVTEGTTVTRSRDDYARGVMNRTMDILKTAKIVILDRQVQENTAGARIVTSSRVTGRDGNTPLDIIRTETALLRRLPEGWRLTQLDSSSKPAPH